MAFRFHGPCIRQLLFVLRSLKGCVEKGEERDNGVIMESREYLLPPCHQQRLSNHSQQSHHGLVQRQSQATRGACLIGHMVQLMFLLEVSSDLLLLFC